MGSINGIICHCYFSIVKIRAWYIYIYIYIKNIHCELQGKGVILAMLSDFKHIFSESIFIELC